MEAQHPVKMLLNRGVRMPQPETVFVGGDVVPERIASGVTIHPGCRLSLAERKDGRRMTDDGDTDSLGVVE